MGIDKYLSMEDIISVVTGLLKEKGYRFCVAGGWAVGIWGAVRATEDIDLVVVTGDDGLDVVEKMLSSRFNVLPHGEMMLEKTGNPLKRFVLTGEMVNDHCVVDIIPASGEFLEKAVFNCVEIEFHNTSVPVMRIEDLVIMKLMSGRQQDLRDARMLMKGNMPVDWDYLRETADGLGVKIRKDSPQRLEEEGKGSDG
ncbi:MAG: nucleotidyl transferase AbiEii/AbiGii toxin family protein [Spirochaetota bacterium]